MVFMTGLLMPKNPESNYASEGFVTGADELIEFADLEVTRGKTSTLYVFYPGLTIEASYESYEDDIIDPDSP